MDPEPAEFFGGPILANLFSKDFTDRVDTTHDFAICIDVLEHLHYDTLDQSLENIRAVARHGILIPACYASAYHLHPIVKSPAWWRDRIAQVFPDAEFALESKYCVARF